MYSSARLATGRQLHKVPDLYVLRMWEALDTKTEPKLVNAFISSVTESLLTIATRPYVRIVRPKVQRHRLVVDSSYTDEQVVQGWSEAVVAGHARDCRERVLLELEPACDRGPSIPKPRFSSLR